MRSEFISLPLGSVPAWGDPVGTARIRAQPEDFQVTEVPLVEPCGEGEHSWVYVQKRNSNTQWVARQLARYADVKPSMVSYAGLKDRRAVTEQWFSIHLPGRETPDWDALQHPEFRVLSDSRHQRKLKTGTLRGNRFILRLRDVEADEQCLVERFEHIRSGGLPNYFGRQRFGHDGANLDEAANMFAAPRKRLPRARRGIYLSAVRSALFNLVLAERVRLESWNRLLVGDALQIDGKSACFVAATEVGETAQRVESMEVHPTGPLCGDGESLCRDAALELEQRLLDPYRAWVDALCAARVMAARRALRVLPREFTWQRQSAGCWQLEFFLPAGSYATVLLEQVLGIIETNG